MSDERDGKGDDGKGDDANDDGGKGDSGKGDGGKGDSGKGLFVQFTSDPQVDIPIPDEAGKPESSMTFGLLKSAQAMGDAQALRNAHRRVIRFNLGTDVVGGLEQLLENE